jgi:hypothetical protein
MTNTALLEKHYELLLTVLNDISDRIENRFADADLEKLLDTIDTMATYVRQVDLLNPHNGEHQVALVRAMKLNGWLAGWEIKLDQRAVLE